MEINRVDHDDGQPGGHDVGIQVDIPAPPKTKKPNMIRYSSIAVLILAVFFGGLYPESIMALAQLIFPRFGGWNVRETAFHQEGMDGLALFQLHDTNKDQVLSLEEFEHLARRVITFDDAAKYERNITDDDEVLTVVASFVPLRLETLTKDLTIIGGDLDALHGLKSWTTAAKRWQNFGSSHFQSFLPEDRSLMESTGVVYWLIKPIYGGQRGPSLSSNRYMPPPLSSDVEIIIHRLLSLFHPLPFVHSRFAPQGSTATVRSFNDEFVDIVFRIHAEFQLNQPPHYPFWFTPAQFTGHLTISKDGRRVHSFNMFVPNEKKLNVDMEWMSGPELINGSLEVDIGHMPEMDLSSTRSSVPVMPDLSDVREEFIPADKKVEQQDIIWTKEIPMDEARAALELKMYPFKKVTYYNFTDGLREASRVNRPLHLILLWGSLEDQSC